MMMKLEDENPDEEKVSINVIELYNQ